MLMRFDPFRELDRLTEQLASTAARAPRAFPMDAYRRGEQFIVQFDLPGVEPAAIDLTVEQNVLTVRAERRFEPRQGDKVVVAERPHGSYTRQVFLGDTLDTENMQANCEHGVLTHDPGRRDGQAAPCAGRRKPGRSDDRAADDLRRADRAHAAAGRRGGADRDELSCGPVSTPARRTDAARWSGS